jgi:hypothetical protein
VPRLPATYHRTHGVRYFHGCYDVSQDRLWGITRPHKGGKCTLAALKSIRPARPDDKPIYVILDNLSANKTPRDPKHHPTTEMSYLWRSRILLPDRSSCP